MSIETSPPTKPLCRHCRAHPAHRPRGLCWTCYYTPEISALYPTTSKYAPKTRRPSDDDIVEWVRARNKWWRPCPFPADDPRYNKVVALREAAGLPARHPGDA